MAQALDVEGAERGAVDAIGERAAHGVRDEDVARFGLIRQSRGEVHRIACDAIRPVACAAACDHLTARDANVDADLAADLPG